MNKTKIVSMMSGAVLLLLAATLQSAAPQKDNVMTKEDGMYVVNTTTLGKNVIGYVSATPVKIYIKKDKIVKVEALKNEETPKYMARVKKNLLNKWDGMKVKDAQKMEVDGVTGATFTSDAIKENIKLGLDYYKKHK
ncbi:FMN-binding protein [Prevotella sp. E13-27]|uniref:FMN-binding protein n=1 Tax=Prevotella sp. E13-27 TaxID=2938122 RepID=UPI00200AA311|nr:FMN-binding protein [Prevotella sp. E13-27]MCK8620807.1 FMN-binding protein [Prevotella sp. E13-27]